MSKAAKSAPTLGAYSRLGVDNKAHGTTKLQVGVITKVMKDFKIDIEVYANLGDAKARSTDIKKDEKCPPRIPPLKLFQNKTHLLLKNLCSSTDAFMHSIEQVPIVVPAVDDEEEDGLALESNELDLVGRTFDQEVPVFEDGEFVGTERKRCTVYQRAHDSQLGVVFHHDGQEKFVAMSEAKLRGIVGALPKPAAVEIKFESQHATAAMRRSFAKSGAVEGGGIHRDDLRFLAEHTGVAEPHSKVDSATLLGIFNDYKDDAIIRCIDAAKKAAGKQPAAAASRQQTINLDEGSSSSGDARKAPAVESVTSADIPVSHGLVRLLSQYARSAHEFEEFLDLVIDIIVETPSHRIHLQGSRNAVTGALQRVLRRQMVTETMMQDSLPIHNATKHDLCGFIVEIGVQDGSSAGAAAAASAAAASAGAPSAVCAISQSMWLPHARGLQSTAEDSSEDGGERLAMQSAYKAVTSSQELRNQLSEINRVRIGGNPDLLQAAINKLEDPFLTRLLHGSADLHRTLEGVADPNPLELLTHIRKSANSRVASYVIGPGKVPTERQQKFIALVRSGRLDALKLMHIRDKEDCGTKEDPLKQLVHDRGKSNGALAGRHGRAHRLENSPPPKGNRGRTPGSEGQTYL